MKYNFNKSEVEDLFFNQNLKIKDVAEKLNCTVIALQRYMRKEGIKIAKRYTDDQKESVFSLLDSGLYTHNQIALQTGLTLTEVRSIIKSRQAKTRNSSKYSNEVSDNFMNNKPLFWYLVGLITTDGHISDRCNVVSIFQNNHSYLENIQKLINHSGKIYQNETESGKIFRLDILNEKFYNFFIENKFDFDKRYSSKLLCCPEEYKPYYFRGIFDGDGCLYYRYISGRFEGKILQITSGSSDFANALKSEFINLKWNTDVHKKVSDAGNSYYDISLDDTDSVLGFCKYIYSDNLDFKLERKYYKYVKLLKLIELDKQINDIVDTLEKSKEK